MSHREWLVSVMRDRIDSEVFAFKRAMRHPTPTNWGYFHDAVQARRRWHAGLGDRLFN